MTPFLRYQPSYTFVSEGVNPPCETFYVEPPARLPASWEQAASLAGDGLAGGVQAACQASGQLDLTKPEQFNMADSAPTSGSVDTTKPVEGESVCKRPVGSFVRIVDGRVVVSPARCKRWQCRACGPWNGRRVAKRLREGGHADQLSRLVTLPFKIDVHGGGGRTWQEALAESGSVLNSFLVSLRRAFPGLIYFWVREIGQKSGMVHFHLLVNRYIPKALLSRLWSRSGGGYVVDVGVARRSGYLLKYLVKYPEYPREVWGALRGKRRYGSSRGVLLPSPKIISGAVFLPSVLPEMLVPVPIGGKGRLVAGEESSTWNILREPVGYGRVPPVPTSEFKEGALWISLRGLLVPSFSP